MQNLKLSQQLQQKLTPQQIQVIKLLQIPTAQLEQRIKDEMEANPALDEGKDSDEEINNDVASEDTQESDLQDEIDVTDYLGDDSMEDYQYYSAGKKEEVPFGFGLKQGQSFHEYLMQQLGYRKFNEEDRVLAEHLIGMIEEDGYLRRPLISITDDLAFSKNIISSTQQLESILIRIQDFDPVGVGARNLQECLLLQIRKNESGTRSVEDAEEILTKHFEAFTKKKYKLLMSRLKIDEEELKMALDEILNLEPKPGRAFGASENTFNQYIIPDYILTNEEGDLKISLNGKNAPELKISGDYKQMLEGYAATKKKTKEQNSAVTFIKQKIDAAKWFIDAIKQRQHTMLSIMDAIVSKQYSYFLTNDETDLKPMILKDIAQVTGYDISTISRITSNKYVQTEFGTYLLKDFFTEAMTTDDGEEVSTKEIKQILSDVITQEDKSKPLSDQKLTEILNDKGYNIARRTIAKYREQLNFPVARLRKEI